MNYLYDNDHATQAIRQMIIKEMALARCALPTAMRAEADGFDHAALWVRRIEQNLLNHTSQLVRLLP